MNIEINQALIDEVQRGRASLFLGAGASREANFPCAEDLAKHLATKAGSSFVKRLEGQPLDFIVQDLYMQRGYGEAWVNKEVIDFFEHKQQNVKRPPSKAHEFMTRIKWRTIFTTNYDRLVEIAYDSSSGNAQRCLPIYDPDPQILRHESDVVRLIKLNGSVDEAARRSSHSLVFTFAEQQNARSRNKEFYNLLREEAVNGPIIFIGFRFAHPGANIAGTSPEFQILLDLLRDMGPSARWHFCVTPKGDLSEADELAIKVLQSNRIDIIDAGFGEFIEALFNRITSPLPLSMRKSVLVPIASEAIHIEPDDYEKDKRHFELLGPHIEEGNIPTVTESLDGHENWLSFINGHFIDRDCRKDFKDVLFNSINNAPEILFLGASAGWGKTFLLRDIAIDFYRERRPVIWLNPHGTIEVYPEGKKPLVIGKWDYFRIDNIIKSINDIKELHNLPVLDATPIIFADNCPERADEVLALFRYLNNQGRKYVLIFSVRNHEFEKLIEEHPLFRKSRHFNPERHYDSKKEVHNLIDFCTSNQVANITQAHQKEMVASRIISEHADVAIILALQVIFDKNHRPFSEIVQDLWENVLNDYEREIIFRVSALHRLGINFSPRLYTLTQTFPSDTRPDILELCYKLEEEHILFEENVEDEPCISTRHSLFAEQFLRISKKNGAEIDNILIMLISNMSNNIHDLEIIRRILKRITDYDFSLSSEDLNNSLFITAAKRTSNDWVVCQQYAKYLVQRDENEAAFSWVERALMDNQNHASLHHTKGSVLRHWGIDLLKEGKIAAANIKFDEARKWFAVSRIKPEPDEYGYVSHLEMILYLMRNATDDSELDKLLTEGIQLYRNGMRTLSQDRFNLLLEDRFRREFDISGQATEDLCKRIIKSLAEGQSSDLSVCFLAQELFNLGSYREAIMSIDRQKKNSQGGVRLWVKEAELHAKYGEFGKALKSIDTAKRNFAQAENSEVQWGVLYWDLIIALASDNFINAREASHKLSNSGYYSGHFFPRGYFWNKSARSIVSKDRNFAEHAKIWSGRIENIRSGERFGQIAIRNAIGDIYSIEFNPIYFKRKDLRRGDNMKFVITILPKGLRADDINSKPFLNTFDDIFI